MMPKKGRGKAASLDPLSIPVELQTALEALYGHYARTFELWQDAGIEVPPCFIVVCNNTSTSKLVYDFVSGFQRENEDGSTTLERSRLALFRNFDEHGNPLARPRTLLIDSEQLESGHALDKNFRAAASDEIERFRSEIIKRTGDRRQAENLSDQDLLREVMNTVGKAGRLGGDTRCVVSVSMLTEGWDASTVTHVLGVRAFGTQLLCEQVIGRALRRQSYDLNEEDVFDVEYADVLGIPFDFTARPVVAPPQPPRETVQVKAISPERDACEIRFPRVQGYRVELPEERLSASFDDNSTLELTPDLVGPSITRNEGIVGEGVDLSLEHLEELRPSTLVFHLTKRLLETKWRDPGEEPKLHLFGQLKRITRQWLKDHLVCKGGTYPAPAHVPESRGHRLRAHHPGDRGPPPGRTPRPGGARSVQSSRLLDARPLHHVEEVAVGDQRRPLPRQLGGLRQRVGGRALPRGRGASTGACLRQEPWAWSGGSLPLPGRIPHVRAGLHRPGGRRARRGGSPALGGRDQGVPPGGCQGEGGHHADLLGAGCERAPHLRALGLRGVRRGEDLELTSSTTSN